MDTSYLLTDRDFEAPRELCGARATHLRSTQA